MRIMVANEAPVPKRAARFIEELILSKAARDLQ